jgi:hypothetical protein
MCREIPRMDASHARVAVKALLPTAKACSNTAGAPEDEGTVRCASATLGEEEVTVAHEPALPNVMGSVTACWPAKIEAEHEHSWSGRTDE